MEKDLPLVISASRRTDLVACYPEYLLTKLVAYPPAKVHTIVIWTKNPANMIKKGPLQKALSRYTQLYVHLTITGLGATPLEPKIPKWQSVVQMLPDLLEVVQSPRRLAWRFDPIVFAEAGGAVYTNLPFFSVIAAHMAKIGVVTCRTSWVSAYKKVIGRLKKKGFALKIPSLAERQAQARQMEKTALDLGLQLHYCCVEGFERSRCIDGQLLIALHPGGQACSVKKAKSQRGLCGCTESLDIGWYSLTCTNGCLYCYAEPLVA